MKKFKSVLKFLLLAALIISQSGVFLGMAESERSVYYVKDVYKRQAEDVPNRYAI